MTLLARIRLLKPADMVQKEFRQYVRRALAFGLDYHIRTTHEKRFGRGATGGRRYSRRTISYLRKKARKLSLTIDRKGRSIDGMPPGIDPRPFEFTGQLKETTFRNRTIKVLKIQPRGRLRMPFGHAIHPSKVGEFDRVTKQEWAQMERAVLRHLQDLIKTDGSLRTPVIFS